jgi:hypothetical protein
MRTKGILRAVPATFQPNPDFGKAVSNALPD